MKRTLLKSTLALTAVASAIGLSASAHASVVVNVTQGVAGVDVSAAGSVDLSGLASAYQGIGTASGLRGAPGFVGVGVGSSANGFAGFSGPAIFGTSTQFISATTVTGDVFDFNSGSFGSPIVFIAPNYVSGSAIAGAASFANATIASLGLTVGSYVYRSSADTITFNIGSPMAAAVPEPATWAMLILGMGAIGFNMRRRKNVSTSVKFA